MFKYACGVVLVLLSRERVRVRVAMPGPLRRRRDALRLHVSREPRDERQRRVTAAATPDDVRKRRPASSASKTHLARGCQKTAGPAVCGWPCAIARLLDVARRPFSAPAAARSQDPVHTEKMTRGLFCFAAFFSHLRTTPPLTSVRTPNPPGTRIISGTKSVPRSS